MEFSFDGINKIITLTTGTTAVDVKDMYSRWKDWTRDEGGSKYVQAFSIVGGEPVDIAAGTYVTTYIFCINGWRIRPQEANHTLIVSNGVLLTDAGVDPFIPTIGTYNVQIKYSQPVRAEAVVVETGVSGLTVDESLDLDRASRAMTTGKFLALG